MEFLPRSTDLDAQYVARWPLKPKRDNWGWRGERGLHKGEIELRNSDIGGIAVHAAARVMAQAGSDDVIVSRVVTDLVAGAGLKFSERGTHELKGLAGLLGPLLCERMNCCVASARAVHFSELDRF